MGANKVEMVRDTYDRSSPAEPEMIEVKMGTRDWEKVVLALRYLGDFSSTALEIESGDLEFLADSISDAAWKE